MEKFFLMKKMIEYLFYHMIFFCEFLNVNDFNKIKNKNKVNVILTNIKSTNGCISFLAQGNVIN